ncbi:hypothetical protein U8335_17500 [Roseiconus lacunae]|uniref:hypothetical protein n=1 Tax=Roseiconus lacunae TaxID=2605694 RepID=UPI00308614AD|nr:hypothetical protein U8335_17500 [Stieleria sp. HD01]
MAKNTQDREDLLRDGTAMPIRGRIWVHRADVNRDAPCQTGRPDLEVVVGFRPDGRVSLYWDQDPVFQFDTQRQLRRVFSLSNLYRADRRRLCLIRKESQQNANQRENVASRLRLKLEPISDDVQQSILEQLNHCLKILRDYLTATPKHKLETIGESESEFTERVLCWIESLNDPIPIADSLS